MKNLHSNLPTPKPALVPDYIFYKFDSLLPGNGFIIQDDSDPRPLYAKLLQEKGDTFSWEYLEIGPKKWSIKISKREKDHRSETLGEMAVSDHRKALILKKYGLDIAFKAKKTLLEGCAELGISTKNVERELNASSQQSRVYTINYNNWRLDYLADFIVTNHHDYSRKAMLSISELCEKSSKFMHQKYSVLKPVFDAFSQLHLKMEAIMLEEEQVLFPYIRFLVHVTKEKIGSPMPAGSIKDHISKLEAQHQKLGEQIEYIRTFTGNYRLPHFELSFYAQVLQGLDEFDNDLRQHEHIENNILFPRVIELEKLYLENLRAVNEGSGKTGNSVNHISSLL